MAHRDVTCSCSHVASVISHVQGAKSFQEGAAWDPGAAASWCRQPVCSSTFQPILMSLSLPARWGLSYRSSGMSYSPHTNRLLIRAKVMSGVLITTWQNPQFPGVSPEATDQAKPHPQSSHPDPPDQWQGGMDAGGGGRWCPQNRAVSRQGAALGVGCGITHTPSLPCPARPALGASVGQSVDCSLAGRGPRQDRSRRWGESQREPQGSPQPCLAL